MVVTVFAVKGLQILATFPGAYFPVSKLAFEDILVKLVLSVTDNFSMTSLWTASLKTLVNIGIFLEKYPDPEKLQSYMSIVVDRIILLITQDDSAMPYALMLEAISDISRSGHTFKLRIVQGVQEAILVKFSNAFVCILTYLLVLLDLSVHYGLLNCCFYQVHQFN